MPAYRERIPIGSDVKVNSADKLSQFQRDWKYHHPPEADQLQYADKVFSVEQVYFYHGGDVLYKLSGASGIWHEQCLSKADVRI